MNKERIVKELKDKYPDANLFLNDEDNPTEIVAEIDPENGIAIAIIDESNAHWHKLIVEEYRVLKGELQLFVDKEKFVLHEMDTFTIKPNQIHFAIGNETWVEVISTPPWSPEDHISMEKK